MADERCLTTDLYALIGSAAGEFIADDRAFGIHDLILTLHTRQSGLKEGECRQLYDSVIRLLAGLMH
ncbi:hypothetical protein PMPD1_1062 [Paramixta manurensis]|uniref:Uncharacterized protein n=1 Tax=Paramixta manurensis TaxID=2740817 RepID=A0A6M8U5U6_9GAMM|nr:hypothetical protein PMPD1_1062 [Erwiniaceae bacterium PD-1]